MTTARSGEPIGLTEIRPRSRTVTVANLDAERRAKTKAAFAIRRVPVDRMTTIISGAVRPRSGDVVLARVESLGLHTRLELASGRKANLHLGDEIIVAYADRYAPDQFESHVPTNLRVTQLVASGGIASRVLSRHRGIRQATRIEPIGLLGNDRGHPLNVGDFALTPVTVSRPRPRTIAVLGTSMNSGKTTTVRYLINGLSRAGHRPGATKVTGTGSGGDYWMQIDAGAHRMLDFTDVGFASTYRVPMFEIERGFVELVDHLTEADSGAILIEVADGIFQQETSQLITSKIFRQRVDGVIFASGEAMGAVHGAAYLRSIGLPVLGLSGVLTSSPLATREAATASGLPVFTTSDLADPGIATGIVGVGRPSIEPERSFLDVLRERSNPASRDGDHAGDAVHFDAELGTAR